MGSPKIGFRYTLSGVKDRLLWNPCEKNEPALIFSRIIPTSQRKSELQTSYRPKIGDRAGPPKSDLLRLALFLRGSMPVNSRKWHVHRGRHNSESLRVVHSLRIANLLCIVFLVRPCPLGNVVGEGSYGMISPLLSFPPCVCRALK